MKATLAESPTEAQAGTLLGGNERWYVVRTQSHREAWAERQLANQGYRTFLPRFLKNRRHARRFETVPVPLFPRYLFVILDIGRDHWRSVNGTYGVERLLMRGGEPEPVPHGLVEQLAGAVETNGVMKLSPSLYEGQCIRVTAGPFADLLGNIERLDDSGRVRVLLAIMGGKVPVSLPEELLLPAEERSN